ncbi:MAG: hypothetical protein WD894_04625 [Pirellulales bacterium]
MSFLDEVRAKRQKLADVLYDDDYSGIRDIVEELYPDRAHFIYELLQNAEDAGATKASFVLEEDSVSFEHNGESFTKDDVWGITNIGKGTKKDQADKIGRFGVGFKAVFAYSETPHIWSPSFSFRITDLVLPTAITSRPELGKTTRFEFPFNSPKKSAQDAYVEIDAGLNELAETTLLFLSHLESIRWDNGQTTSGEVRRIQHSGNHFEVLKKAGGNITASSHFLRFVKPVEGMEKQCVAVAFALDCLPNVSTIDPKKALVKQLKIIPAHPGRVAVYFPADKETSGLRFHLHAPFVPELSRASIKETPANDPLFQGLAELTAAALHSIRDLKLLTADFLSVLPNPLDDVPVRYERIRAAIVEEMNNRPLTPTHAKSHAPAKDLVQAKASLKELLSEEDLGFLVEYNIKPPKWAMGAAQRNSNTDRFLIGLAITDWDIDKFIDLFILKSSEERRYLGVAPWCVDGPEQQFMAWLAAKPMDWHQQMYAIVRTELQTFPQHKRQQTIDRLKNARIVRLSDGGYSTGKKCYFPSEGIEHDKLLPRVDKGVYSSGKSKTQQDESRQFLTDVGVREVGETEQVEAILQRRYTKNARDVAVPNDKKYWKDLKRFIALVEREPATSKLFATFYIFKRASDDWGRPADVFLDSPYFETRLSAYYDAIGKKAQRATFSQSYQESGVPVEQLKRFAEIVGVQKELNVEWTDCSRNPKWTELQGGSVRKVSNDSYRRQNDDFDVPEFETLTNLAETEASRLIWHTMTTVVKDKHLIATYRRNNESPKKSVESRLVRRLMNAPWIPQTGGRFVCPANASAKRLPERFPFDAGDQWLKAIHFGEEEEKLSEEHRQKQTAAEELGFPDTDALERVKRFAAIPVAELDRMWDEYQRKQHVELPDNVPRDPERRAGIVGQQAADAADRITEQRTRSVSIGREDVKREARQYLRQQYTKPDGEMMCQVCKGELKLPFKLDDGTYYFEAVEFLRELKKLHRQNFLTLCPNHSAMFQHANGSRELITTMFAEFEGNYLDVILAQEDATIYFTKTHIADLRKVIDVDRAEGEAGDADGAGRWSA